MKIIAFVPIKLNSERLHNKNKLMFSNGTYLLTYIFNTLRQVSFIDAIYAYCNKEYSAMLPDFVQIVERSPDCEDESISKTIDDFVRLVPAQVYILSPVTAPFVSAHSIQKGLEQVLCENSDSATSVEVLQDFIWSQYTDASEMKPNYSTHNIPRTQDLPKQYKETSGFYIFRDSVVKTGRRIGDSPYFVEVSKIEAVDIDTQEDWQLADIIASSMVV